MSAFPNCLHYQAILLCHLDCCFYPIFSHSLLILSPTKHPKINLSNAYWIMSDPKRLWTLWFSFWSHSPLSLTRLPCLSTGVVTAFSVLFLMSPLLIYYCLSQTPLGVKASVCFASIVALVENRSLSSPEFCSWIKKKSLLQRLPEGARNMKKLLICRPNVNK